MGHRERDYDAQPGLWRLGAKRQRRLWRKGEAMKEIVGFALFIFGGGAAANDPSLVAQIGRVGSGAAVAYRLVEIWMTAGASVRIEILCYW